MFSVSGAMKLKIPRCCWFVGVVELESWSLGDFHDLEVRELGVVN